MLLDVLLGYALAGLAVSLAFVTIGVTRVLPDPAPVTVGARIVLMPAAMLLWPYVLWRMVRLLGAR